MFPIEIENTHIFRPRTFALSSYRCLQTIALGYEANEVAILWKQVMLTSFNLACPL
jgi:hypothetical protein